MAVGEETKIRRANGCRGVSSEVRWRFFLHEADSYGVELRDASAAREESRQVRDQPVGGYTRIIWTIYWAE